MFKSHAFVSISLDPLSKPFWSSGDVLSGSVSLVCESKLNITGIEVTLQCKEKAVVADDDSNREIHSKGKTPMSGVNVKKSIVHLNLSSIVLEGPDKKSAFTLEKGEHMFPFAIDISENADVCPPSAPVKSLANHEAGVRWKVKAIVRMAKKLQLNLKTSKDVPVFPQPKDALIMNINEVATELSGEDVKHGSKLNPFKKSKEPTRLFAKLIVESQRLPQRPVPIPLRLSVDSYDQNCQISGIHVNLNRQCTVSARGKSDVYTTVFPLKSMTISRKICGQSELTSLMDGSVLPELLAPAFQSQLVGINYELALVVDYIFPDVSSKLHAMKISTRIDLVIPWQQWTGRGLIRKNLRFDESVPNGQTATRTIATGTTHSTGFSLTSSAGTVNSYEITRPGDVVTNLFSRWTG